MKYAYCTLFNSNYLDKGLVTIYSLLEHSKNAVVYVLCMDEKCYDVLITMAIKDVVPIQLSEFESEELLKAKANRSPAEYCWTCSGSLILYVLERYEESNCTYIDADLYFFRDPSFLIDEMIEKGKSVLIVEHGFKKDYLYKHFLNASGRFCVEFNTFLNNEDALNVLKQWIRDILFECSADKEGSLGDQSYLTEWPDKYDCVYITEHIGAGLAPWNINRFRLEKIENDTPVISEIGNRKNCEKAVFYHYQYMRYIDRNQVNIGVYQRYWKMDKNLVDAMYRPYLTLIEEQKKLLETMYGIEEMVKVHPAWSGENKKTLRSKIKKLFGRSLKNFVIQIDLSLRYRMNHKKDTIYI